MFEEICLLCGKHLPDDGRAYCSDECQNLDTTSPSISSASSALSSPYLGYAVGGEVPALVPSALGSALSSVRSRDYYSVSSSSASSTAWSVVTDDEDEPVLGIDSECSFQGDGDSTCEGTSKSANLLHSIRSSALSYTRRPSGTNNHSTVPLLHKRTSSGSLASRHVQGAPRSAPIHSRSSAEEDEDYSSDYSFSTRDDYENEGIRQRITDNDKSTITAAKHKRTRNRASLPAYFSLLQVSGSPAELRRTPISSSVHTIARPSPPTPKLTLAGLATGLPHSSSAAPPTAHKQTTPRGRRREPGSSRSSRRSGDSVSRSPSRSRSRHCPRHPPNLESRARLDSMSSVEQVFDWTAMPMTRGRTTLRRNSSPPPKILLSALPSGEPCQALISPFTSRSRSRNARSGSRRARGRTRIEELDGVGGSTRFPGYGHGRSGLLDRERIGRRGISGLR